MIERAFTATGFNEILNDPFVRPDVADMAEGVIDVTPIIANHNNVLLMGEHGGQLLVRLMPGVYEVHTATTKKGRRNLIQDFATESSRYMFTRTDCYEVVTRVPDDHRGAQHLVERMGMRWEFVRPDGCVWRGKRQRVQVCSYRIQDWIGTASALEDIGEGFHDFLHSEAKHLGITAPPHEDDPNHNRYVGAVCEMIRNGQVWKGVNFYNRWALVSRHPTIQLMQEKDPTIIKFDIGLLVFENGEVHVERTDMAA